MGGRGDARRSAGDRGEPGKYGPDAWLCFPLEEPSKAELAALSLVGLGYRSSPQVSGIWPIMTRDGRKPSISEQSRAGG